MASYIKKLRKTGESEINVEMVCKNWDDRFSISVWEEMEEGGKIKPKYTLLIKDSSIKKRPGYTTKTVIIPSQAIEVINNLELKKLMSPLFKSGYSYHSALYIQKWITALAGRVKEKEGELLVTKKMLECYNKALN